MNSPSLKHEGWLYGLAFLIALALRFIALGASPLTDSEATLALQSLALARGESPLLAPQSAYILFTAVLFAIMESANFLARFLPALAGSMLVFAPYFFREKIHPRPALILAFLFVFDPGLVALSRQANGTMLAVTFLLFAWGMWNQKRLIPTGIFAGLALLSGPSLWAGLLTLGITHLFIRGMKPKTTDSPESLILESPTSESPVRRAESVEASNLQPQSSNPPILESPAPNPQSPISSLQSQFSNPQLLVSFLATLLLCGTLFFLAPNGLSAALASLPAYLKGWVAWEGVAPSRMILTILFYELLGILLAALAIFRAARANGKRAKRLIIWLGTALLLAVFYRQPAALAWVIIPLLALAASELSRAFEIRRAEYSEVGIVTLAILILLIYISFTVSNLALNPVSQPATLPLVGTVDNPPLAVLISSFAILLVCIALVALGWSARIARLGATIALTAYIGLYTLATAWGASGLRYPDGFELWMTDSKPVQADLLLASVKDISEFSLGHDQSQPVLVVGIDSPALAWVLRNHSVKVVSALDPQTSPPLFITPVMDNPGLPAAYRGQDFTWRAQPQWKIARSIDWLSWIVFRTLPAESETIILWARDDLFPDARSSGQP
ncbi:MAG: hypothetical protein IPM31_03100 [Anaerolineae bacterium]|nr:hypothetical protein [Anaerolineae bacterium]MBL8104831.1 hypothetical protein [Anaerolineales bacterium]MCC7189372.1 hypothetical protein [Anaerolineales bacterium]